MDREYDLPCKYLFHPALVDFTEPVSVANPKKCKLPDKERPDAQYATTQMIAHRVDGDSAEPAFTYLERMPREFQVSGIRAAMQKTGPSLLQSKKFAGWLRQNQDLLVAANLLDPAKGSK